jgi:3-deoxy-D-manno-octulosonate 8-phosphate phosphatase (KDO 8-P phosphatase)
MTPALAARLRAIRLLTCDVDGVLTDGRIYVDDDGRESKAFCAADGIGLAMLRRQGVQVAWITGSVAPAVRHRAERLGIEHVLQGHDDKLPAWQALIDSLSIKPAECAHIGDDLPDLALFRVSGVALTVPHAPRLLRDAADYVTRTAAGRGAVREACELLLEARGELAAAHARFEARPGVT